jgi:membrane-bound lytic murein transglycosylase A
VKQEDGSFKKRYLSYHGSNKRKFAFIYHHMLAQGMISEENRSLEAQRKYLEQHPLKRREVYATNPSYIFFKVTDDEPLGVGNIPLTQGRSLAIDTRIYKWPGMLHFVQMDLPQLNGLGEVQAKQMKRFFLSQDTGGAIRGPARIDLYMGYGRQAEVAAHNTQTYGDQFILVYKDNLKNEL